MFYRLQIIIDRNSFVTQIILSADFYNRFLSSASLVKKFFISLPESSKIYW